MADVRAFIPMLQTVCNPWSRTWRAVLLLALALGNPTAAAQAPARFDKATFDRARELLKAAKYSEAADLLQPLVTATPQDPAPLYLLGLVRLQEGRLKDATDAVSRLRGLASATAISYADKLAPVLEAEQRNAGLREEFTLALRHLDAQSARAVLARMEIADSQRGVLSLYLDLYSGRMSTAAVALNGPSLHSIPPAMRESLRTELTLAASRFRTISEQLRWYTESSLALSACRPTDARERSVHSGFLISEYVQLTELGHQLFPFNEALMDAAFHGALLSAPYDELKPLGLQILQAKGQLRLPFFSSSARFDVVIDARQRRLFSQLAPGDSANPFASEALGRHVLFDLGFDAVTGIKQSAKTQLSTASLAPDSYALRLSPQGQAPHYLFMPLIHCLYGEDIQKAITLNLGRFVVDVIGDKGRVKTELEDPARQTRDRLQIFSQIVGVGTLMAASAAEQAGREPEKPDGRMSGAEALHQTATEAETLMTRRQGLLRARESLLASQREAGKSWSESLASRALDRSRDLMAQRIDDLAAFVEVK